MVYRVKDLFRVYRLGSRVGVQAGLRFLRDEAEDTTLNRTQGPQTLHP